MRGFLEPPVCILTVLISSAPPEFIPDWAKSFSFTSMWRACERELERKVCDLLSIWGQADRCSTHRGSRLEALKLAADRQTRQVSLHRPGCPYVDLDVDLVLTRYRCLDVLNTPCRQLSLIHGVPGPREPLARVNRASELRF